MKSAVFLYNTQSGKCKIGHCTASICTVFRAYGYEIVPQPIDFEANPFDGNEQIDLMVVAGGDGLMVDVGDVVVDGVGVHRCGNAPAMCDGIVFIAYGCGDFGSSDING
mgnify:FL=1